MKGFVKWFNAKKGYGFITGEDKKDYFVHYSEIEAADGEYRALKDGQAVEFVTKQTEKGTAAARIKKI